MTKSGVVIGIGNPLLKDDRAGIVVAETLEAENPPFDVEVLFTVGFEVVDKLMNHERAIVVDACQLGLEPGSIVEVDAEDIMNKGAIVNSHAVTLGSTIKAGLDLFEDEMPTDLRIILIEAEDVTEFSRECTPKVTEAIATVVDLARSYLTPAEEECC